VRGEPREQRSPRCRDAVAAVDHQHSIPGPGLEEVNTQGRRPDVDEPRRRRDAGLGQGGLLRPAEPLRCGFLAAHSGPLSPLEAFTSLRGAPHIH